MDHQHNHHANHNQHAKISRDDAVNHILMSIAMEELALSHVIHAESEKIHYTIGTLKGKHPPKPATIDEVLKVNASVKSSLETLVKKQEILTKKMTEALNSSILPGPPGPPGPPGENGVQTVEITEEYYNELTDEEKHSIETLWVIYPEEI